MPVEMRLAEILPFADIKLVNKFSLFFVKINHISKFSNICRINVLFWYCEGGVKYATIITERIIVVKTLFERVL